MSDTPNSDLLLELARTLVLYLESPEPGMHTWHDAVHRVCSEIGEFGYKGMPREEMNHLRGLQTFRNIKNEST